MEAINILAALGVIMVVCWILKIVASVVVGAFWLRECYFESKICTRKKMECRDCPVAKEHFTKIKEGLERKHKEPGQAEGGARHEPEEM